MIDWSDEDKAYVAALPDLPGCVADGSTREEALRALDHVAKMWIARAEKMGRHMPQPQSELISA